MVNWTDGDVINTQARLRRLSSAIPSSYTVFKIGSTYYAETNTAGGTDYEGADAGTVINAALADADAGLTFFRKGTYTVPYLTLQSNANLKGEGVGLVTIKQADGDNGDVIAGNGKSHIAISDLTVDGNKANNPTGDNGISLSSCSDVLIRNVVTKDSVLKGIALSGCHDVTIRDSETYGNESDGYVIASITPNGLNSYNVTIDNCHIHHDEAYGIGVITPVAGDKHPYDIFLTNNNIHDLTVSTNLDAINLKGVDRVTIRGNHMDTCDYGVLGGQSVDFPATNTVISGNIMGNIVQYGIQLDHADNTTITGNRISTSVRAIYMLVNSNFTTIVGNDVRGNTNLHGAIYHLGTLGTIASNQGYMTEASGTVEAAHGDAISFVDTSGLRFGVAPHAVFVNVDENDARYIATAHSVGASQFILALWDDTAGVAEAVDKTIQWRAYSTGTG